MERHDDKLHEMQNIMSFYFAIFLQEFDVDKKVDFTREDYDTREVKEMKTKGNLM